MVSERIFRPLPFYWGVTGVGALLAALFVGQLWRAPTAGSALFLLIALGIVVWGSDAALSRVILSAGELCLLTPLRGRRCVQLRQLASVTEGGRINPVVGLVYHPQLENGLLDLDTVAT